MLFLVSNVNKAFKVECPSLEASVDFNISRCEDEKNTVVALQNEILMVKNYLYHSTNARTINFSAEKERQAAWI